MANDERLLTTAEVAERLGKGTRTVQRMAASGQLPYVRKLPGPNGSLLFDPAVIDYLVQRAEAAS